MKTIIIFLFAVVATTTALELPSNFKICKRSDPKLLECISNASTSAVISLAQGLKSFKILPVEPLAVNNVQIGEIEGPVSLKQEYRNVEVHGLTKGLQVHVYEIDWDNLIFKSDSFNPQVDFVGEYKVEGKVLLLPIQGEGKCNISMYDLKTKIDIYFERFQKDGETYLRATKNLVKFLPKHVTLHFGNLFDKDPALGMQMDKFINENADSIFKELRPPFEEVFGLIFAKITNDIFTRVPFNKLIL